MTSTYLRFCESATEWDDIVSSFGSRDFFHQYELHRYESDNAGDGRSPVLIVGHHDGEIEFAFPAIRRPLEDDFFDLVSVYGYAGPLLKTATEGETWLNRMSRFLQQQHCVSIFARLHPLLHRELSASSIQDAGTTVSIPMQSSDSRMSSYHKTTRYEIRRLEKMGAESSFECSDIAQNEFAEVYYRAMGKMSADPFYFFPTDFFSCIGQLPSVNATYGRVFLENKVIAAGLFTSVGRIGQYFLGGATPEFQKLSPLRFLIHHACDWAIDHGAECLHLGGGRGGREDGLLAFKERFSSSRHTFKVMREIVDPGTYSERCEQRAKELATDACELVKTGFFPAYRATISDHPK